MTVEEREEQRPEGKRRLSTGQSATLLMLGAAALIGVSFWRAGGEGEERPQPEAFVNVPPADFNVRPPPVIQALAQVPPPVPPPPSFVQAPPPPPPAPTVAASRPSRMASYAVRTAEPASAASGAAGSGSSPEEGEAARTAVAFRGQRIAGKRAGAAMDTSLVLMPGIYGCVLDTAVNSERPGPFQCHTTEDIRSPLGVPLMEAGTTIIGQYESDVRPGQSRIPAIVVTAWTPQGIPVPLGAIASDALGRAGMPGQVNRHLMERFGGALALLGSQGAIDLARAALAQGQGNSFVNINTGSVQGVASDALRGTIGMRNTVEKNQGEAIAFFVTEPVSFEDSYRLRMR